MIDLSHLTEEEKNMILAVLKRDAELKQAEDTRIRSLHKSVSDKAKLKYLTGEWFYETKSKRHQDRIHGSDIIRASMRQRKGVTILELSQMWTEKPSFVNSDNKEVFVPPELSGLIEEPAPRNSHDREHICNPADMLKPVLQSPTKRQNPFNSQAPAAETLESIASQLTNGAMEQTKTPGKDSVPSSPCSSLRLTNPQPLSSENRVQPNAPVPIPIPRKRTILCRSHDSSLEIDGPASRQSSHAPRGILKHNSSCSSTDSLPRRLANNRQPTPQIPATPDSPTNPLPSREPAGWLDRKQVRFSSAVGRGGIEWSPELQDGKELGEHSLLDLDVASPSVVTAPSEGDPKTVHEDMSRDSEDDGQFLPVTPLQDEEEASPCIRSPSCKQGLNTQTQVTGSTHVPVDQCKHDDRAEPLPPQVFASGTADQTPGKPLPPGSGTENGGDPVADTCEPFSVSPACSDVTKLPAPKPEILVGSVLDAGSGSEAGSEKDKESAAESPNPRRGLLGIFRRSEAKEKTSEESTQSPVKKEALLSGVEEFDPPSSTGSLQPEAELPSQQTDQSEAVVASISDAKSPSDAGVSKLPRTVSPKPRLFGIFSRGQAKEKSPETERAVENETTSSEDRGLDDVMSTSQTDSTTTLQYQHETDIESDETLEETEVLQPEFLSEDAIQSSSSVFNKVEHEVVKSEVEADEFLKKLSNLKSFWEREYSGPKILIAKSSTDSKIHTTSGDHCDQKEYLNEDPPKIETTEASSRIQSPPLDRVSSGMTTSEDSERSVDSFSQPTAVAHPENPPPVESSVLLNIPSADGTFTARPILISDETDSSPEEAAAASQVVTQPRDDASSPVRPLSPSPENKGEGETVSHERPLSPAPNTPKSRIPKPKDASDDELRKGPSKTCHPKALPREVTNCKGSNAGSPLKTFPIDIASPSKELEEESENQTVGQRKSPSHEAKQALKSILKIPSSLPQCRQDQFSMTQPRRGSDQSALSSLRYPSRSIGHPGRRTSLGNLNLSSGLPRGPNHRDPTARRTSEGGEIRPHLTNRDLGKRKSSEDTGVSSLLARSFIPQIVQRVDTTPQGTDVPPFIQEQQAEEQKGIFNAPAASIDVGDRGLNPGMDSEESQDTSTAESSMLNVDGGSSSGGPPKVQSRAGRPCSYHEDASPRRTKLKAMPQRPKSFSKSLEDLTSRSSTLPPRPPSFSDSEDMKMISASVSAIPQEEKDGRDSDCTSESSLYLGWRRNANSLSNLSLSSGMVSMSSAGSMVSIYSGEHGDVEVKGSIQLALNYVQKLGEFHIFVVHCRELAVADPKKKRSNPYIKCYLLPDKAKMGKKKTSVKNKTLNPTYNEILRFKVTMETLKTQKLNVSVWHNDNFGRNNFLGELELDLTEWDFNNTQINEYTLKPRVSTLTPSPSHSQSVDGRGEMRVALRFLPRVSYSKRPSKLEAGEMQVWVKDCKNLPPVRGVIIDPFVKCAVLPDSGKRTRQKTRVVKRTTSPMFNHTMVYDGFRPDDLREIAVEITVWDHDRLSNHFIGGLRIGIGSGRSYGADVAWMDSTAEEVGLWERMMQAQSEWVEAVLPLRMLLMARAK